MGIILIIVSILANIMMFGVLGYIIYRKGGIAFLKQRFGKGRNRDTGYGPYYDQRRTLFEILPREKSDIIFVGHSLVDGCEWAELLNDSRIKNRGINGELTAGILKRFKGLIEPPPAKIFIMTGANDIAYGLSPNGILRDFQMILDELKLKCPTTEVYIISLLPIGFGSEKLNVILIKGINERLKELSMQYNYTYIDLYSVVQNEIGMLDSTLTNDGSHLMGIGYQRIFPVLKSYID